MKTLRGEEINLEIEDFECDPDLFQTIRKYFDLLKDYMVREKFPSFIHTREYF